MKVCAILNDTTGCLLACAYKRPDCAMGVILGTGIIKGIVYASYVTHLEILKKSSYEMIGVASFRLKSSDRAKLHKYFWSLKTKETLGRLSSFFIINDNSHFKPFSEFKTIKKLFLYWNSWPFPRNVRFSIFEHISWILIIVAFSRQNPLPVFEYNPQFVTKLISITYKINQWK